MKFGQKEKSRCQHLKLYTIFQIHAIFGLPKNLITILKKYQTDQSNNSNIFTFYFGFLKAIIWICEDRIGLVSIHVLSKIVNSFPIFCWINPFGMNITPHYWILSDTYLALFHNRIILAWVLKIPLLSNHKVQFCTFHIYVQLDLVYCVDLVTA